MGILAAHSPPSQHGEVIEALDAIFLDGHSETDGYPARGGFGWDADGLIGIYAGELRHIGDVGIGVVLVRRRPTADDGADGVQSVLVIVSVGYYYEFLLVTYFLILFLS